METVDVLFPNRSVRPQHGEMLCVADVRKAFGPVVALDGCSFDVHPGQMLGLLGPNGAGKTTVMRSIFGLVRIDAGGVAWAGRPIDRATRRRFGYMPEERGLYPKMPVGWQLGYLGRLHGLSPQAAKHAAERWLERFGLADRKDSKLRELSHGNQQRVQLIAALLHEPELVVLDEPFAGLDPLGSAAMAGILADVCRSGAAVVFSSHQLDVVEDLCRDVAILHMGRIVLEGGVQDLRAASRDRYVEVVGGNNSWMDRLDGGTVVEKTDGRIRVLLSDAHDGALETVSRHLAGTGVTQFTFEPPPLSEVFRKAVTHG